MKKRIVWSEPNIRKEEHQAVNRVLKSEWLSQGPETSKFEKELGSYIGNKKIVALNNGTSALIAGLMINGVKAGDEVIVPGNTFVATINSVLSIGAKPKFVDCDFETWNTTPELVEPLITEKTKAIMPVDAAGSPCDYKAFIELGHTYNIPLIFDSAESMGARYKKMHPGYKKLDAIFVFSFHMAKQMSCVEGGAITLPNNEMHEKMKLMRSHGMEGSNYLYKTFGLNFRTTDINSAIGRVQLKKLRENVARRKAAVLYYKVLLGDNYLYQKASASNTVSANMFFGILSNNKKKDLNKLKKNDIPHRICWPYIGDQPAFKDQIKKKLPNAKRISEMSIALPLGNCITKSDVERVCEALLE